MSFKNISEIWETLKKEAVIDKAAPFLIRDFRKSIHENPVKFTAARSFPDNDYGVLLEADKIFFPKDLEAPNFENFEIKYITNQPNKNYVWFFLKKESDFQKQFELICLDIIDSSIETEHQKDSISNFVHGIVIWQELLKEKKSELSDGSLKGLFAELYFLSEVLFAKFGISKALNCWKPNNQTHDFVLENSTVEVKSTSTSPPKSIKVNSLKQLDETMTKSLYLYLLQLGENKGESVPEIIDKIKKIIKDKNPEDLFLFEKKIFNEKYNEKFKDKYLKRKFFKNHEYVFMIEKDFPRIREKDLAELKRIGILKVSYEISLAACETYKISMDKFIKSL
mgnify:CR=1 FL=1|jgi:hypothetical protein|tara:strand:+ start:3812 stop:4825 length:1014 start_codon:yes stop_codon:yes gene_type:complete